MKPGRTFDQTITPQNAEQFQEAEQGSDAEIALSIWFPRPLLDELATEAAHRQTHPSDVVRDLVDRGLHGPTRRTLANADSG